MALSAKMALANQHWSLFYMASIRLIQGLMTINGQQADIRSSSDAIACGIGMVHQHFMLVPNFTALENVILGYEIDKKLAPSLAAGKAKLQELSSRYGLKSLLMCLLKTCLWVCNSVLKS